MVEHRALWLWGILLVAGCKDDGGGGSSVGPVPEDEAPQTAVSVICTQFEGCGCDPPNAAPDGCEASIDEQVRQAQGDAVAAGLEYDGDCMGRYLSARQDLECRTGDDLTLEQLVQLARQTECKVFYGTAEPGQPCVEIDDLGDSCARNAVCYESLCVAITAPAALGEECNPALELSACTSGAFCVDIDLDQQPTCVKIPAAGDPCLTALQLCDDGLACQDGTCVVAPGEGEACHMGGGNPCASGLGCNLETFVCETLPQGGEDCTFYCADGFDCLGGRCVAQEPTICDVDIYDGDA